MRCDLQIFSGCVWHLEQLHAQSPFLFPIVFSINCLSHSKWDQQGRRLIFEWQIADLRSLTATYVKDLLEVQEGCIAVTLRSFFQACCLLWTRKTSCTVVLVPALPFQFHSLISRHHYSAGNWAGDRIGHLQTVFLFRAKSLSKVFLHSARITACSSAN